MARPAPTPIDWNAIDLVVFDMDGTLYDQKRLRARMLAALLRDAIARRSLDTLLTLRSFRRCREALSESPAENFLIAQYAAPAARRGCTAEEVRALVADWMEERPLPLLAACRRPGVRRLFEAIARKGKRIAILSDYPAAQKLAALGLTANFIVTATDPDIGRPKPDPAGLQKLLRQAGIPPDRAVLIGDRVDRDWAVAARVNMRALILSRNASGEADSFATFDDALFQPLFSKTASTSRSAQAGGDSPAACRDQSRDAVSNLPDRRSETAPEGAERPISTTPNTMEATPTSLVVDIGSPRIK
jgi:HAD superfamily hydrolase (TIGR01549 family)